MRNAVGALSTLSPTKLLPRVMEQVIEWLTRLELRQVTREEYAIMLTPEGELYDKSIVQRYKCGHSPSSRVDSGVPQYITNQGLDKE